MHINAKGLTKNSEISFEIKFSITQIHILKWSRCETKLDQTDPELKKS